MRPRPRSRPADSADRALERVTQVLAGTTRGGWVPPPEPDDAAGQSEPPGPAGESADQAPDIDPAPSQEVAPDPARVALQRARRQHGRRALTSWLPPTLRAGRVDLTRGAVSALLAVAVLAALVTGLVLTRGRPQEVAVSPPRVVTPGAALPGTALPGTAAAPGSDGAVPAEVVVAVAGKVARPGLVRLPGGSRVDDAVRAAGGPLPGVDLGTLNLARKVLDGEQVLVGIDPPPGAATDPGGPSVARPDGLLDLNAAGVADFDALPGIGPVLAQRIVDWREQNGPFRSVDQLREVTGIGEAKYADLQAKVIV